MSGSIPKVNASGVGRGNAAASNDSRALTKAQKKAIFATILFLGICAIAVVTVLALPEINRLRWQVSLGTGLSIGVGLVFAFVIYCKKSGVSPISVPVASTVTPKNRAPTSNKEHRAAPLRRDEPVFATPIAVRTPSRAIDPPVPVNPLRATPRTAPPVPVAPITVPEAPRVIDSTELGRYTRRDFTTGDDKGGLKEIGAVAVSMFFDHLSGKMRQAFPKTDVAIYMGVYARLQNEMKAQWFPREEGVSKETLDLEEFHQRVGSTLLHLSDEELGFIILMMKQLEENCDYSEESYWMRKPSLGLHVSCYWTQHTYQNAVVDPTVATRLAPLGLLEQLYPLKLVEVLRANRFMIDALPEFDIKAGAKNRIELENINGTAVRFIDDYGRRGIAFSIQKRPGFFESPRLGVLTLYQRFSDTPNKWTYQIGGGFNDVLVYSQDTRLSLRSLAVGNHPFGSDQDYTVLSNLLAGRDPFFTLVRTV